MSDAFRHISLVELAMQRARAITHARMDLSHFIFPAQHPLIDEHFVAGVKHSLYMVVFNIERALLRAANMDTRIGDKSLSYPMLYESGLLNDQKILDASISLFKYHNLRNQGELQLKHSSPAGDKALPILVGKACDYYAQHEDVNVRECAKTLSIAESRSHSLKSGDFYELDPEDLHRLTWRIVATFEIIDTKIEPGLIEAAAQWLERYKESDTLTASVGKLIYLLKSNDDEKIEGYWNYSIENVSIYIGLLENVTMIERHNIINILTDRSPSLSALLFRAAGLEKPQAMHNILSLYSDDNDQIESNIIAQIADRYLEVEPAIALQKIQEWASNEYLRPTHDDGAVQ